MCKPKPAQTNPVASLAPPPIAGPSLSAQSVGTSQGAAALAGVDPRMRALSLRIERKTRKASGANPSLNIPK